MNLDNEILINQYAQDIVSKEMLINRFDLLNVDDKRNYLMDVIHLIKQSKPIDADIEIAISNSRLKTTYTPCVLLRKGIDSNNLYRIAQLPENELGKVFALFIALFAVAYKRRYDLEKNAPNKWWYWDLSVPSVVEKIIRREEQKNQK
jgi:hypothetical protein